MKQKNKNRTFRNLKTDGFGLNYSQGTQPRLDLPEMIPIKVTVNMINSTRKSPGFHLSILNT